MRGGDDGVKEEMQKLSRGLWIGPEPPSIPTRPDRFGGLRKPICFANVIVHPRECVCVAEAAELE